jgi:hypothetical protein
VEEEKEEKSEAAESEADAQENQEKGSETMVELRCTIRKRTREEVKRKKEREGATKVAGTRWKKTRKKKGNKSVGGKRRIERVARSLIVDFSTLLTPLFSFRSFFNNRKRKANRRTRRDR